MLKKVLHLLVVVVAIMTLSACIGNAKGIKLPDLTGKTDLESQTILTGLSIDFEIQYEESDTIGETLFIRYSDDLVSGDYIDSDDKITVYFSIDFPELPDLTGYTKSEIKTALESLDINYIFEYETNTEIDEDKFVGYGGDDQIGTTIDDDHVVVVKLATTRLVLPDLTGKNQSEIIGALMAEGIDFTIKIITDNTVPDQTFSGYGDNLEAGDLVPSSYKITVYLGFNQTQLPDLTGLIKEQIVKVLDNLNILYEFAYVVNDTYAEDVFANYKDMNIGDYYDDVAVTVNLYKNTFTDDPTSLIISKYVDGGDTTSDQAIEIFNPTNASINLADYYIAIYNNGSLTMSHQINFGNIILESGEAFVIANSYANENILAKSDLNTEELVFDGNDTIQICYSNGTYIDTIYNLGNKDFVMDNEVFIRGENIVKGTRTYVYSEWYGYIPSYIDLLGSHPVTIPQSFSIQIVDRVFDDPLGGMDLVTLSTINDGDTAAFTPGFLGEDRVRFVGVDTPETYPVTDPWGQEAKAYTTLILNNAERIYIQSDPEIGYTGGYGRHLGLVWVDLGEEGLTIDILASDGVTVKRTEHLSGWILLNYHLVLNGYSYNYYGTESRLTFENRYLFRWFQEAERFASQNGLGIHE